jgi:hypothetical protein
LLYWYKSTNSLAYFVENKERVLKHMQALSLLALLVQKYNSLAYFVENKERVLKHMQALSLLALLVQKYK